MPLYEFKCLRGHDFDRVLPLARYDEPQNCECGSPAVRQISAAMVAPDLPEYVSPVTGKPVRGRRQRHEDLRRNNCVPYEPSLKDEYLKRKAQEESKLDKALEHTLEGEISKMPARKRELLEQEVRAGASVEFNRSTPNL